MEALTEVDHSVYLRDRTSQRYFTAHRNLKKEKISFLRKGNTSATAAYARAWSEMRCLHASAPLDDLLYTSDLNEHAFGVVGSRDGMSRCSQRVTLEIIVGYLVRRYQYSGECTYRTGVYILTWIYIYSRCYNCF